MSQPSTHPRADPRDEAGAAPIGLALEPAPPRCSPNRLIAELRAVVAAARGTGGAIYRLADRGTEIVVGIGRGLPPELEPAAPPPCGARVPGGRIWSLGQGEDSPALLFVAAEEGALPVGEDEIALARLQSAWTSSSGPPDPEDGAPSEAAPATEFPELVGRSSALLRVLRLVERIASTRVSVLILGESGTGKELIGRALHRLSGRTGRFISENCAAIADSLLEGELFGTEKGAYTGANSARAGLIEEADGGTLFLDEIAEMGGPLQSKLLRVLQEKEVRRLGSSNSRPVDFRLVSATHRDIDQRVTEGQFRADLLFRIDVVRIELPPLRERTGDVPLLAEHFLAGIARAHGRPAPGIEPAAMEILERFPWPGNVRELRNEIERAFALSPGGIGAEALSPRLRQTSIPHPLARQIRDQIGSDLERLERVVCGGVVRDVLRETGGNKAEAARRLGIPKTNLYRRLERYGIPFEKRGP